jgi:hypothetical protein
MKDRTLFYDEEEQLRQVIKDPEGEQREWRRRADDDTMETGRGSFNTA